MSSNDVLQSYFLLNPVCILRPERMGIWKSSWNTTGISEKKSQDLENHDNSAMTFVGNSLEDTNLQTSVQRI
jgi:hypothetical protein